MNTPRLIRASSDSKKEFKYLISLSDLHIGAKTCNYKKIKETIELAERLDAWVILLGDICEIATRYSVGSGIYEQLLNPQEQQDKAVDYLLKLSKKGNILGMVNGNHEERAMKEVGLNITKNLADLLEVPYLGYSSFFDLQIGEQRYTTFGTHGSAGSTMLAGAINSIKKLAVNREADLFLMGHVHRLWHGRDLVSFLNKRNKQIEERERHFVLTGAYLDYADSYGEMKMYEALKLGTPLIKLYRDVHRIEVIL